MVLRGQVLYCIGYDGQKLVSKMKFYSEIKIFVNLNIGLVR